MKIEPLTKSRPERGPVPPEVRRALADLDVQYGRARVLEEIGISNPVFVEATAPGGILRPIVLAKIQTALAAARRRTRRRRRPKKEHSHAE